MSAGVLIAIAFPGGKSIHVGQQGNGFILYSSIFAGDESGDPVEILPESNLLLNHRRLSESTCTSETT
jgi:hypothetical protein